MEHNADEVLAGEQAVLGVAEAEGYGWALRSRPDVVRAIVVAVLDAAKPHYEANQRLAQLNQEGE